MCLGKKFNLAGADEFLEVTYDQESVSTIVIRLTLLNAVGFMLFYAGKKNEVGPSMNS